MTARFLGLLPLLVCLVALGRAANAWDLAALIGVLATILAIVGPRWELDRGRRLVTSAMGAGIGYAAAAALYDPQGSLLGGGWVRLAAAAVVAAAVRSLIVSASRSATVSLLFAALIAIGETRVFGYWILAVLFLVTSLWALSASDATRPASNPLWRRLGVGGAMLLVAGSLGLGTTVAVRSLHSWLKSRAHSTAFQWRPRVGFSDRMDLGSLEELIDSDTIVLRVHGPRVDHLRGAVLDFYESGRWLRSSAAELETDASYIGIAEGNSVVVAAVSERTDRFFLPLEARHIVTSPSLVLVDGVGTVKRAVKGAVSVGHFVRGPREQAIPSAPSAYDLQLPRRMRPALADLALKWTEGANTASEKLDAIELRLRSEFRYARGVDRKGAGDPAFDFLFRSKRGHCEYFATAMALVARAAHIPARVVTGYRVAEHSPFGYYVVRERNAHAWLEAWVTGVGWTTRDPTPDAFLSQNRQHEAGYAASIMDAISVGYDDFTDWLGRLTVGQTAIAWLVGFIVLVWIVARGARRRRRTEQLRMRDDEAALPCLDTLLTSVAQTGHARRKNEPIERLASRVPDQEAAQLLARYAALRYGSIGDARQLADDVTAYAHVTLEKSA